MKPQIGVKINKNIFELPPPIDKSVTGDVTSWSWAFLAPT